MFHYLFHQLVNFSSVLLRRYSEFKKYQMLGVVFAKFIEATGHEKQRCGLKNKLVE